MTNAECGMTNGEGLALAVLAFLRCGRGVVVTVRGHAWADARPETRERFLEVFPRMQDKPCSRAPERVRAPAHPLFTREEAQQHGGIES